VEGKKAFRKCASRRSVDRVGEVKDVIEEFVGEEGK